MQLANKIYKKDYLIQVGKNKCRCWTHFIPCAPCNYASLIITIALLSVYIVCDCLFTSM